MVGVVSSACSLNWRQRILVGGQCDLLLKQESGGKCDIQFKKETVYHVRWCQCDLLFKKDRGSWCTWPIFVYKQRQMIMVGVVRPPV